MKIRQLLFAYIWWRGAINEEEVGVVNARLDKLLLVVLGFVEADDAGDSEMFEDLEVVFW